MTYPGKRSLQSALGKLYAVLERQWRLGNLERLRRSGRVTIGRHSYGSPLFSYGTCDRARVVIGPFVSIAPGVRFIPGGIHPAGRISLFPFRARWDLPLAYQDGMPATKGDILVGSDVWIGTDALILSGVTIGHGAIVAARSVVTRDVPPYSVVAGAPARVIRYRFAPEIIQELLAIAWWEWDDARIRAAVSQLSGNDVEEFIRSQRPRA